MTKFLFSKPNLICDGCESKIFPLLRKYSSKMVLKLKAIILYELEKQVPTLVRRRYEQIKKHHNGHYTQFPSCTSHTIRKIYQPHSYSYTSKTNSFYSTISFQKCCPYYSFLVHASNTKHFTKTTYYTYLHSENC